jgi:hypothetical protein
MAEIILYVDTNFGGSHTHRWGSVPNLKELSVFGAKVLRTGMDTRVYTSSWDNQVSSLVVVSGIWRFFKDAGYRHQQGGDVGPGLYPDVRLLGMDNDSLSSIQLVE